MCAILLTITCGARSQNNERCLDHDQLKHVYGKVVRGEQCERKLDSAKSVAYGLQNVVNNQNKSIQGSLRLIKAQNDTISSWQSKYTAKSVELQSAKDKPRPWWEWVVLGVTLITGIVIAN